jgi:Fe-S-cluster formation regulator IscX/YfhJ
MEAKRNNKSILDLYGVRFVAGDKHYFSSLLGQCFHKRQIIGINTGSTGNATLHLSAMHNIVAGKTLAHQRNAEKLATYIEGADKHFTEDPSRWFQVNISAFACEQSLSYNAFNSPIWKVIANKLPVGDKSLTHFNICKHYVEHYVMMKKMIMGSICEAKQVYTIPFLSVSLDLIQNAVQNKKLIGVRVSYIRGQDMKSWNLAVRGYYPTEQEVREGKASALLINWLGYIFQEYDIDPEVNVLTLCTDSGSDVKQALEVELPTHRKWCVSHLIHLALGDAFGSSVDPKKTKNTEIRDFITACQKVAESVNKSKLLKMKLEEAIKNDFGTIFKLCNSPTHPWSSVEDALVCLLKYWNQLIVAYNSCSLEYPIKHERQLHLELHSVIYPLQYVQRVAQQTKELVVFQVYMHLMHLYFGMLNPQNALDLYDPSLTFQLKNEPSLAAHNQSDRLQPTSQLPTKGIDPGTQNV